MNDSIEDTPPKGYVSPRSRGRSGERIVVAPGAEKVAVELELAPGFTVTALFPYSNKTLSDIAADLAQPHPLSAVPSEKLSHAEKMRRLDEIAADMKSR